MYDSWKADDISDKADEVTWTILPRGNASRILKYKAPQKYLPGHNSWTGIGVSDRDKSVGNNRDSNEEESWNTSSTTSSSMTDDIDEIPYFNHAHVHNPITKISGAFSTFPLYCSPSTLPSMLSGTHYKSFNNGLTMLLIAIRDISDLARQKDRTATLPHPISGDDEITIGGLSWGVKRDGKEENFNRASKFFLTNLKWLVAFYTKQHY